MPATGVALVQERVALVQDTLRRPFLQITKTPFAPSLRSLGTTPISGKTLLKGHSRSSGRVPGYSRSSSRNSETDSRILGMASHDLSNTKTTILGATLGAIPGIDFNHMKDFHLTMHSRSIFSKIGVVPARQTLLNTLGTFEVSDPCTRHSESLS